MLGICAVVAVGAVTAALLAGAASTRHRAEAAADLAALAAADVVLGRRPGDACGLAAKVASQNGTRLTGCRTTSSGAVVAVTVRPSGMLASLGDAEASAHAGAAPTGHQP
jgi:secretion/DNA translocation related TadE-like protein